MKGQRVAERSEPREKTETLGDTQTGQRQAERYTEKKLTGDRAFSGQWAERREYWV